MIAFSIVTLATLLALAGWRYVTKPAWHHCRWCGCFWTDGWPEDNCQTPAVADEGLCPTCCHQQHGLERRSK
jgi:hypothetical protein